MTDKVRSIGSRASPKAQLSTRKKLLFSALTTLLFFLVLEGLLILIGFEPVTRNQDPYVGFSSRIPLMEESRSPQGEAIISTAKNKLVWFNDQSFPKNKGPKTKRIFCMGGSTTYGHPYWDSTSFSRWMREYLPLVDPSYDWEVINAGGISYASYRVAALMEELIAYQPDLFVVYSVHNEFLERRTYADLFDKSRFQLGVESTLANTRTWAVIERLMKSKASGHPSTLSKETSPDGVELLPAEVDEILNHTIGPIDYHRDPVWRSQVLNHYESNLKRMVQIAKQAGAKIIFVTPASNEKDCSPFKSEFQNDTDEARRSQILTLLSAGAARLKKQDSENGIRLIQDALKLDPSYAETHYQLGKAYFAAKRFEEARRSFAQAIEEDICPLRAVAGVREAIDRVHKSHNIPLVDFEDRLRSRCRKEADHEILGDGYFMDHVHPNIEVHRLLGLWIIDSMRDIKLVPDWNWNNPKIEARLLEVREKVFKGIDRNAHGIALRNLAKVLHWSGKFQEAIPCAIDGLQMIPHDSECRFVLASSLRNLGRADEALEEYDKLFENGRDFPRAYIPFADLLIEKGHFEAAKAYLLLAIVQNPKNASAFATLGFVHMQLGEYELASESFEESNRLVEGNPFTMVALAQSKFAEMKYAESCELYRKLIEKLPAELSKQQAELHFQFGMALGKCDKKREAFLQFEEALKVDPDHQSARDQMANHTETVR